MRLVRPLPRGLTRTLSILAVAAWVLQMGVLLREAYFAAPVALAADLSHYGSSAQWKGIYYRGDKIGFSVGQTLPTEDGYEIREDGRLQMTLLGASTAVRLTSVAMVDRMFSLRRFDFSLDPGTGPTRVSGEVEGRLLHVTIATSSGERTETRELAEAPALSLNLPRVLAARGLEAGQTHEVEVFDPTTLSNTPMTIVVQAREVVRVAGRPMPAFRVEMHFAGIVTRSWITDVGEVVREESPTGFLVVRQTPEQAQALAVPGQIQADLLEAAAIVPSPPTRIDDPTTVALLRVRLDGAEGFGGPDMQGAGQEVVDGVIEVRDARELRPGPLDPTAATSPGPGALHRERRRADPRRGGAGRGHRPRRPPLACRAPRAPRPLAHREEAHREPPLGAGGPQDPGGRLQRAHRALRGHGPRDRHTGPHRRRPRLPAGGLLLPRLGRGLARRGQAGGLWLPVDPTLNQFPADATHVRLARGRPRQAGRRSSASSGRPG